ncbi:MULTISPECIES: PadR family transcriptional regulator [Mumia]|uniref:PadR family transcriptional regulator n=1 Tax=Mumia TaxID=1546255 RepID=UPI0014223EC5|nr:MULTISPECIES: PadR family transcriptional regulator [unclassified Mumia]QMW65174.1 PadR family transcriptional regulator [Mumia sp. ZJ1417]
MAADLSTTSYALLGLLALDPDDDPEGLTGYELKQRCDQTMRYYWVSPATSQVYTELARLARLGLVDATDAGNVRRSTRRYALNTAGRERLLTWLTTSEPDFPVLKHPVALRLMFGHMVGPEQVEQWLSTYIAQLEERTADLRAVREMLGDDPRRRSPARVAEWGLAYFASESAISHDLRKQVADGDGGAVT